MTTDLELLQLAAKACELPISSEWGCAAEGRGIIVGHGNGDLRPWNPLADDGEALRLAIKLHIGLDFDSECDSVIAGFDHGITIMACHQLDDVGTRRAIVRAAAEIGRSITAPSTQPDKN